MLRSRLHSSWLWSVLYVAALLLLQVEADFFGSVFLALLLLLAIWFALGWWARLLWRLLVQRQPFGSLRGLIQLTLVLLSALFGGYKLNCYLQELTECRAQHLVQTLEHYRRQRGHYPARLQLLVPRQLPAVPTTAYGLFSPAPFRYSVDSTGFLLGYESGVLSYASYSSTTRRWSYSVD